MGLRDEIQADVAEAFNTDLADAVKAFTGQRIIRGTYDPVTDTTTGDTTINYSGRGTFGRFKINEIDNNLIMATDVKLLCLQNEIIQTPVIGDSISNSDGPFEVINVGKDNADVTWTFQLRKV